MVKQYLEALHGIARPGVVAGNDQIRGCSIGCLKSPPSLGCQQILYLVWMPCDDREDLTRTADQVADRPARPEPQGCGVDRSPHRVAGCIIA